MTITTWLRTGLVIGLFCLFVTPLVITNSLFFPFISGKAFFFRILVELLFGAWLVLICLDRNYRPRRSLLALALGALLVVVTLATVFGQNPYHSFWSNSERMEGLIT